MTEALYAEDPLDRDPEFVMQHRIYTGPRDLESALHRAKKALDKPDNAGWQPPAEEREQLYVCEACGGDVWEKASVRHQVGGPVWCERCAPGGAGEEQAE